MGHDRHFRVLNSPLCQFTMFPSHSTLVCTVIDTVLSDRTRINEHKAAGSQKDCSKSNASELYSENHRVDPRWDISCPDWVMYRPVYLCVTPFSPLSNKPPMPSTSNYLPSMVYNCINWQPLHFTKPDH